LAISENGTLFGAQIFNLININRNTGQGTFLTNIASTFNALDFNPITGVLYGSVLDTPSDRLLATLNPGDGSVDIISVLPVCSDALVFSPFELSQRTTIPAISEWGMMILAGVLGVIAFCSAVRRKYSYRQ
jgi:hypothetical protein